MVDVIDPSITARIGTGSNNPLTQVSQIVGIQNAMNQNALFQQTYRARAALGPLAQAAVGADGQMDWDKYAMLVSGHPDTAWMAPQILNDIASRRLVDAQTVNEKLKTQGERSDRWGQILMTAGQDPEVGSMADFMSKGYVRDGYINGALDPKNQQEHIAWMADPKLASLKPDEFRKMLTNQGIGLRQGAAGMAANASKFGTIGFDPATGQEVSGWSNDYRRQITPQGGPALHTQPITTAGGQVETPNIAYGTPSEAQKQVWKDTETQRQNLNGQEERGQQVQILSAKLRDALARVHAGGGAEAYQEAGKFLQSLGFKNDTVDAVANGSLPAGQTVESLARTLGTMAVRQLFLQHSEDEGSAGRLTGMEWQKTVDTMAQLGKDPRANEELLKFMDHQYALRHAKAQTFGQIYNDYHSHKPLPGGMSNPTQFEPWWGDQLIKRGLMPTEGSQ